MLSKGRTVLAAGAAAAMAWPCAAADPNADGTPTPPTPPTSSLAPPALPSINRTRDDASGLVPLDSTHSDMNPVGVSLMQMQPELEKPTAWMRAYRVPAGRSGIPMLDASGEERVARMNGAITAVFPRSQYVQTKKGVFPEVSAGTIFVIGGLKPIAPPVAPRAWAFNAMDMESRSRAPMLSHAAQPDADEESLSKSRTERADLRSYSAGPYSDPEQNTGAERNARAAATTGIPAIVANADNAAGPGAWRDGRGCVLTDEAFRRQRVRDLLTSAAGMRPTATPLAHPTPTPHSVPSAVKEAAVRAE